ncbi:hypothetical protein N7G274_006814 [Stereocaulon virgatum]|uniref:GLEYA adhesin domain-containing protein n=1 Tax=Stereocaulon virgatum TaxID=373712 RepID=A0ABR4A635_9LECA
MALYHQSPSTSRYTFTHVKTTSHTVTPVCTWIATLTVTIHTTVTHSPVTTSAMKATATATHTPSTKTTITKTATPIVCSAPPSCTNQGLQWAHYPSEAGPNFDNDHSNFNPPSSYKTQWPRDQGITHSQRHQLPTRSRTAKKKNLNPNLRFRHRLIQTLLRPQPQRATSTPSQQAPYTFTASGVDDTVYPWLGHHAYAGWTLNNANLHVSLGPAAAAAQRHPGQRPARDPAQRRADDGGGVYVSGQGAGWVGVFG